MRYLFLTLLVVATFAACKEKKKEEKDEAVNVISNGVNVAYTKCGKGDTTLLFIHGWCINKEYWNLQEAYFCPRYTVVSIDLPGFGKSGTNRTNWTFDAYTDDVKNVIDQLHLKNVILMGHSMSGDIVINMSNKYPSSVIGIVGVDNLHEPGGPLTAQQQDETDSFLLMLRNSFDSTVYNFMRPNLFQPTTDPAIVKRVMNDVFNCDSSIAIAVLKDLTIISQKEKTLMQGLSHKLYLVNSSAHPVTGDSLAKYCNKGYHVELVLATGHYPMIEKPELFNAALQKVVDDISKK